ncbi:MAG: phosphoribosyltransferase [Treponemataceae bacterium]
MSKDFLAYEEVRNNAFSIAHAIHKDGFIPDIIYVSLRGGAYLGNVISEYFKITRTDRPVLYAAVVARSYSDVQNRDQIMIDGWTHSPDHLRSGDKILLVDDIFDTGKTINYLVDEFMKRGVHRHDIKVAVHDYKHFENEKDNHGIKPDYWCKKYDLPSREEDVWIHCLSHELVGLTPAELDQHYFSKYPHLRPAFAEIIKNI